MLRALPLLLALAALTSPLRAAGDDPEPIRFVRISLPGEERTLSLAEVQVMRNGRQVANAGVATQSSDYNGTKAARAVDGNTDGNFNAGSVTHTNAEANPWWELDLGSTQPIERVVVWNRSDCCADRLRGFTIELLDERRKVVWKRVNVPAPHYRVDFAPWDVEPVRIGPSREEKAKLQPGIDAAIQRGLAFLETRQLRDGSYAAHADRYASGSTGLALYTMLKCGMPREHPAVQRSLHYVLSHPPDETYAIASVLMALGAYDDPEHRDYMEELLDMLLSYQGAQSGDGKKDEVWGYPKNHTHLADLSNTQYAALGLRAAHKAGFDVPKKVWTGLMEGTLRYQCDVEDVELPTFDDGRSSTGSTKVAGWPYRAGGNASGSMTTAGLGVLAICEQGYGKLPLGLGREVERSQQYGLAWLGHHFSVDQNLGHGTGWLYYYLYGLERVGALYGVDTMGGYDWYWEGAQFIVSKQEGNGSWEVNNEEKTCFALLFLSRATADRTTGIVDANAERDGVWVAEEPGAEVQWRITGKDTLTFWVSGFSDDLKHDFDWAEKGQPQGLRVLSVDYLVDDVVIASVEGDGARGWAGERFPIRHAFDRRGTYKCEVRAHVADPDAQTLEDASVEAWGDPLMVEITDVLEPWMLEYAAHGTENLFRRTTVTAASSSKNSDGQAAHLAIDGRQSTGWVARANEQQPWLTLTLDRPQRGNRLLLSHLNASEFTRNDFDRATRVRVRINNKDSLTFEVDLPDTDDQKGVLELPKSTSARKIEITILGRSRGDRHGGQVGFAEVEWLMVR